MIRKPTFKNAEIEKWCWIKTLIYCFSTERMTSEPFQVPESFGFHDFHLMM